MDHNPRQRANLQFKLNLKMIKINMLQYNKGFFENFFTTLV